MKTHAPLVLALLLFSALAGCTSPEPAMPPDDGDPPDSGMGLAMAPPGPPHDFNESHARLITWLEGPAREHAQSCQGAGYPRTVIDGLAADGFILFAVDRHLLHACRQEDFAQRVDAELHSAHRQDRLLERFWELRADARQEAEEFARQLAMKRFHDRGDAEFAAAVADMLVYYVMLMDYNSWWMDKYNETQNPEDGQYGYAQALAASHGIKTNLAHAVDSYPWGDACRIDEAGLWEKYDAHHQALLEAGYLDGWTSPVPKTMVRWHDTSQWLWSLGLHAVVPLLDSAVQWETAFLKTEEHPRPTQEEAEWLVASYRATEHDQISSRWIVGRAAALASPGADYVEPYPDWNSEYAINNGHYAKTIGALPSANVPLDCTL